MLCTVSWFLKQFFVSTAGVTAYAATAAGDRRRKHTKPARASRGDDRRPGLLHGAGRRRTPGDAALPAARSG